MLSYLINHERGKNRRLMIILIAVIVILLGIIAYAFVLKPVINGYVIKTQSDGIQYAVYSIMQQAAKCPTTGVPLTFGNVTMNIVALECYQQAAQAQQVQTASAK